MNFDGYTAQPIPRFGSIVQSDDGTELPFGIASDVQNCRFRHQSVGPRDGFSMRLAFDKEIMGVGLLRYLASDNSGAENIQIIAATTDGNVSAARPFDTNSITQLTTDAMLAAAGLVRGGYTGFSPQLCQAYNKMILARGDLTKGVAAALIVDGQTLTCDPVSDKPFGDTWQPLTIYRTGQVVSPSINTGNLYLCTQAGTTAAPEPVWPLVDGQTVSDGAQASAVIWTKINIVCTSGLEPPSAPIAVSSAAGTTIPAGATIFLVATWTNQFGESTGLVANPDGTLGNVLQWENTTGAAADVTVALPPVPADIAALASQYSTLTCNLYGYVATGTPDPTFYLDPTSYAYIGTDTPGASYAVAAVPTGQQLPQTNNAFTTGPGNVSSGVRYMIVLYMTRTGYICGFSAPAPIRCDISVDGRQMLVQNLPLGPYNCVARICAFTVAGQGSAGPYFYIPTDDYVDPGLGQPKIKQTATKIPDNVTQAAYFDFLDTYLTGAVDVTDYFDRIELPPCSDAYFSKSLNRVIYAGALGYPSALLISDLEDAEAVRDPGSVVNVSVTDGDRVVCLRDLGSTHVAYKENSAHAIVPNDGDPSDWDTEELWSGSGPCGPRAIDVAMNDGQKMHAFAHRTGGYVWTGNGAPTLLTKELIGTAEEPGLWDRINWQFSYKICTTINLLAREIYFFVPLDNASSNSCRITVNYMNGLDDPIIFVVRSGREVPNINGRKWSRDSIAANHCIYVPQRTTYEAVK